MISSIVAISKNYVIGNNGLIPWRIKGEQKRFRELTTGKTIIMGRKSYEEIGKPLPNRKTIILSNTIKINDENCVTVSSLQEALRLTKDEDVFVAGGGRVYQESMPFVDRIYLTVIDMEIPGDTFFPSIAASDFLKTYEERIEGEIPYTYYTYDRICKPMK